MGLTEGVGKKLLAGLVVAGAAAVAAPWLPLAPFASSTSSETSPAPASAPANRAENAVSEGRFASFPARASLDKPGEVLFSTPALPPLPVAAPPQAAAQPAAPPMPYRVAGNLVDNGGYQIVLAKGDRVFIVREGYMLEDGYRVESVRADAVTLLNIPLGVRQDLAVDFTLADTPAATSAAAPAAQPDEQSKPAAVPAAARLRWEGPESVQEGDAFDVTLRVTSEQPVRALPLQLSYDAKLLEPVGVRPGSFFAGGNFNYHVSPNGSILIGASGQAAVPSDAEIVVVSFKPIGAGATTELVISSVTIQGAEGRAIAPDRPVFRTNIIP
jgi:Cohesin domain